jgi:hypothetical protein
MAAIVDGRLSPAIQILLRSNSDVELTGHNTSQPPIMPGPVIDITDTTGSGPTCAATR